MTQISKLTQLELNNGVRLPLLGLGVWSSAPGQVTQDAVTCALDCGYKHIDTASVYENEADVGLAIEQWKRVHPNRAVFVTTKLSPDAMGYDQTIAAFTKSQQKLGQAGIDLYLMHWPDPVHRKASWLAMESLYKAQKCKAIGVSNFTIAQLEELKTYAEIMPAVNQVEYNVYLNQQALRAYCAQNDIAVTAYSPLARMQVESGSMLSAIAQKHNKSVAQICIRWLVQQGIPTFPKSIAPKRIQQNYDVFDFSLSHEDMNALSTLDTQYRCNPEWDPEQVS